MANTSLGTPYVTSSDYVTNYPTTSLALANAIDAFGGVRVYTNEAARNAAITSPFEGMVAYLTSPTTPAATGQGTFIPSGVTTVYNGSVWVCTTEVGCYNDSNGTTTSTAFTGTLGGSPGTNLSVTIVTGTTAMVTVTGALANSIAGQGAHMSVAVSGATTLAASVTNSLYTSGAEYIQASTSIIYSGLTPGTNTFTANYRVGGSGTATIGYRRMWVKGIA